MRSIYLIFYLIGAFLIFATPAFSAGEMIMFNSPYCEWCDLWEKEVGLVYNKTRESRIAPVRRGGIHDPRPDDLKQIRPAVFTPTFVLIDDGKEMGRITGYPGEGFFWGLLGEMVEKLPIPLRVCNEKKKMALSGTNAGGEPTTC